MSLKFEGKRKMKRLKEKTKEKLNISEEKAKRSKENEKKRTTNFKIGSKIRKKYTVKRS